MNLKYTIERWSLGWTISSNGILPGIPMDALGECMPMFPKNAHLDQGIAHHLKTSRKSRVMLCIVTPNNDIKWRFCIEIELAKLQPEQRWWCGLDVGRSAASLFSCFSSFAPGEAASMGAGAAPQDSDDLGRCIRLLNLFPQWRADLQRVATIYPNSRWPQIIARWDELEAATPQNQTLILQTLAQG